MNNIVMVFEKGKLKIKKFTPLILALVFTCQACISTLGAVEFNSTKDFRASFLTCHKTATIFDITFEDEQDKNINNNIQVIYFNGLPKADGMTHLLYKKADLAPFSRCYRINSTVRSFTGVYLI